MENLEDDIRDLREKNSELAQEVQFWKVTAGQKEKEKLELMKEVNELRLKLSRMRSGGAAVARKLDAGLQTASEEALSHLVQASGAVARTLELAKQYLLEQQELDSTSPRWSNLGGTSSSEKVNRVPPLLLGGQSIQPVVSLSRTMLTNRSTTRNTSQNSGVTHRAMPIHMLQDVYIPLTRIDAADLQANNLNTEDEQDQNEGNSTEDLELDESNEQVGEESQNFTSMDDLEESRRLDAVMEDQEEPEEEVQTPARPVVDNPLEGPSWLLDVMSGLSRERNGVNLEPDSTTPCDQRFTTPPPRTQTDQDDPEKENAQLSVSRAFTPTVRRRKRASSPPPRLSYSPRPSFSPRPRQHSGRVLKVLVAKMRLSDEERGAGDSSPPKRAARAAPAPAPSPDSSPAGPAPAPAQRDSSPRPRPRFDAPSPNGATDAHVIVSEAHNSSRTISHTYTCRESRRGSRGDARRDAQPTDSRPPSVVLQRDSETLQRDSRAPSRGSPRAEPSDSDSSAGAPDDTRTRRTRRNVSYKEKPLNRKLRR